MSAHGDSDVNWGVEVEIDDEPGGDNRVEYYAASAIMADGEWLVITTADGCEITLDRNNVVKILLMRTMPALPPEYCDTEESSDPDADTA